MALPTGWTQQGSDFYNPGGTVTYPGWEGGYESVFTPAQTLSSADFYKKYPSQNPDLSWIKAVDPTASRLDPKWGPLTVDPNWNDAAKHSFITGHDSYNQFLKQLERRVQPQMDDYTGQMITTPLGPSLHGNDRAATWLAAIANSPNKQWADNWLNQVAYDALSREHSDYGGDKGGLGGLLPTALTLAGLYFGGPALSGALGGGLLGGAGAGALIGGGVQGLTGGDVGKGALMGGIGGGLGSLFSGAGGLDFSGGGFDPGGELFGTGMGATSFPVPGVGTPSQTPISPYPEVTTPFSIGQSGFGLGNMFPADVGGIDPATLTSGIPMGLDMGGQALAGSFGFDADPGAGFNVSGGTMGLQDLDFSGIGDIPGYGADLASGVASDQAASLLFQLKNALGIQGKEGFGNFALKDLVTGLAGLYGANRLGKAADRSEANANAWAARADPFSEERSQYQDLLSESYKNPFMSADSSAMRRDILQAAERRGARGGQNPIHTRLAAEGQIAKMEDDRRKTLAQLAGAQFSPSQAAQIGSGGLGIAESLRSRSADQFGAMLPSALNLGDYLWGSGTGNRRTINIPGLGPITVGV
jgi:hypothetical protein